MAELNTALLMFISYRSAEARILAAVNAAGHAVSPAQAGLLARIGPNGTRLTDLADQARTTKQSAGFLVDQLEKAGYIERVPDPSDARARLIRLAARGKDAQKVARRAERAVEREWERHLGEGRIAALREALVRLREITDPFA